MNGWNFKRLIVILARLSVVVACDGSGPVVRSARQHPARTEPTPRLPGASGLRRVGAGIPTHVKAQYAGGMGFMSFGCGWDYGKKCRWETDVLVGFSARGLFRPDIRPSRSGRITFRGASGAASGFAIEPFTTGVYLNLITGELLGARIRQYPATLLRLHLAPADASLRRAAFPVLPEKRSLLRHITLYYELSTNDLDIVAKCGNKSLDLSEIVYFSVGIKFQLLR